MTNTAATPIKLGIDNLATMVSWSFFVNRFFVNRLCNCVAHELACFGRDRDPDHPLVWMHPHPGFVYDLLVRDVTAS